MNKLEIKSIEKKIIKDKELLSLLKKKYKSISKLNIDEFIEENNEKLKKMNSNRNWKIWFASIKEKYKKEIKELKEKKEKEKEDIGKGTGIKREDKSDESLDDSPGKGKLEAQRNKERERERRKKEKEEIEKQLKPYNTKLIDRKDIKKYIGKKNKNVLVLNNEDNVVIDDENLFKLKNDEGKFIHLLDDGRKELVDDLTEHVKSPFSDEEDEIGPETPRDKPPWWKGESRDNEEEEEKEEKEEKEKEEKEKEEKEEKKVRKSDEDEGDDDNDDDNDEDDNEDSEDEEVEIQTGDLITINENRKAFVDWVNDDLYEKIENLKKDSPLQIYQLLVREYLSLETPYRGVLVYHGLGTGKTASAVSLAEGLSSELKINTLLPASLETEFIKEIQKWGKDELNKKSLWKYYSDKEISEKSMISMIEEKYNLSPKNRKKIMKNTQNKIKRNMLDEDSETSPLKIKKMQKDISKMSGVWLPDDEGKLLDVNEGEEENFTEYEKIYIEEQINLLIRKKYNFIHYNPFPKVSNSSIKEFVEEDDEYEDYDLLLDDGETTKLNTENKRIVNKLETKLKKNRRENHSDSPFNNEVLIIDEVHNFVRQILNESKKTESKRAKIFYEWIVNAKDVKLIFLSGTPVINQGSEIAILYNMLKGLIRVYTFTVVTKLSIEEINQKLNDYYYKDLSSIELFHVSQKEGKITISYIQESSNFKSLKDNDSNIIYTVKTNGDSFDQFINHIYDGLHSIFDKEDILPKESTFKSLSIIDKNKIQFGENIIYDENLNIPFNRHQKLFDININDELIDMTNNSEFMKYFFENGDIIPDKKKTLLKRMLMGLTSYYPIDRSSIVYMPQIVKPEIKGTYSNYSISGDINIVECKMSELQFNKYWESYEWQSKIEEFSRNKPWQIGNDDEIHHYNIRTRQACNVVFNDEDNFRMMKKGKSEDKELNKKINDEIERSKQKEYEKIKQNKLFKFEKDLEIYSPKFHEIYKNMQKFMKDGKPTGKILFYSDFRSDAGSEAFELMLQCNGYSKLDTKKLPETKELRYTFITGSESQEERRLSKLFFNDENNNDKKNKFGEYCQIMIISSAGAEGISLTCVRQVHILEPYWNYVRINQVFGRAIRMRSHTGNDVKDPWLPKEEQNVEQYLYLSIIPDGHNIEEVYKSLLEYKNWDIPKNWKIEDVKKELSKHENLNFQILIDNILALNTETTQSHSADIYLFFVMLKKYGYSQEINNVIKESSLDCIKHTSDDPILNDRCIRFSDKLTGEIAYFPGMSSKILEEVDIIQLKTKYIYKVDENIYVISAKDNSNKHELFLYYEFKTDEKDPNKIDIRYLRENGRRLADLYMDTMMLLYYVDSNHIYNDRLDKEFSVYQEIYKIEDKIVEDYINKNKFPKLNTIIEKRNLYSNLQGYKLKYNINETFYFMGLESILPDKCIQKIYPYTIWEEDNYIEFTDNPIIILGGQLYIKDK